MPKISTYTVVTPQGDDKIIISDSNGTPSNATKNITVDGLASYVGSGIQIPTPEMWVYKSGNLNPYQTVGENPILKQRALCINVPTLLNKRWLDNNPRLFLFRYRPSLTTNVLNTNKRGNYVHPSHLNGQYIQTNFPGSNWCSSPQYYIDGQDNRNLLFPITTEWDFNGDLKYVQKLETPPLTPGVAITDFKTVRSTAYVEVPFNPLQFLFDKTDTQTPFTSLPISLTNLGERCMIKSGIEKNKWNTNTPFDSMAKSRKIYFKFAIGIPNPTWTNTNKQTPYIMGDLSNAITFVYQSNQGTQTKIQAYQMVQGHSSMITRNI